MSGLSGNESTIDSDATYPDGGKAAKGPLAQETNAKVVALFPHVSHVTVYHQWLVFTGVLQNIASRV